MPSLSFTGPFVLQGPAQSHKVGFEITGLPIGPMYPTLSRLESQTLVRSDWEADEAKTFPKRGRA